VFNGLFGFSKKVEAIHPFLKAIKRCHVVSNAYMEGFFVAVKRSSKSFLPPFHARFADWRADNASSDVI
jgi:hypothetical protein